MQHSYYTQAALVADSLSLATHWIYNQSKISRTFPNGVKALHAPISNYHGTRVAGDFTHYGDQTIWLANAVENGTYQSEKWRTYWLEHIVSYDGYVDGASKETLANDGASPSGSNDLAGASRIAPLLSLELSLAELILAARSQTALTHGDVMVQDAAEFFSRAVRCVENGEDCLGAFRKAADEGTYSALPVREHLESVISLGADEHLTKSSEIGLTCHTPEAFPLVLYYLIHHGGEFGDCVSKNALAGGDTSARAMLIALLFAAKEGGEVFPLYESLNIVTSPLAPAERVEFTPGGHQVEIDSKNGKLSAVLEYPEIPVRAVALFAHCFTCGKDFLPGVRISRQLAKCGIATLRVDFSGVGMSEGDFAATSFLTNIDELYMANKWLADKLDAAQIVIGHSLGGAAAYAVAGDIEEVKAVVSIGAPFDPGHVLHMLEDYLDEINEKGIATVQLAGREFNISKKFVEDMGKYDQVGKLNSLDAHKLVMHAPGDQTVPIENAGYIYSELKHPKSFISLAGANHLLTDVKDAQYVAKLISVWVEQALG